MIIELNVKKVFRYTTVLIVMLLYAFSVRSQVYVGGNITSDQVYSPDNNPYIVTQTLIVQPGVTLTILPGVRMLFEFGTGIINNGILVAKGTVENKIVFRSKMQNELQGSWDGIICSRSKTYLKPDSTYLSGSVISDAEFYSASYSLILADTSNMLVENCFFSLCSFGVYVQGSINNIIRNSVFNECDFGIYIANGFYNPGNLIYRNQISRATDIGIFISSSASESNNNIIAENRISYCNIGMHVGNFGNNEASNNRIQGNQFMYNKYALKLFHSSNHIYDNYFVNNTNGAVLWKSDNNTIKQNLFSRNVDCNLVITAGSNMNTISNNSLNYSKEGLWIKPDSARYSWYNSLLYNTIYDNTVFSVQAENSRQGPMQFNNIGFNGNNKSFINQSDGLIYGSYNYWGTTSNPLIDSIIYDFYDDPHLGEVKYAPILDKILSIAPVPPPRNVVKQIVGDRILVSWDTTYVDDLQGYSVCFGKYDGVFFNNKIDPGLSTSYLINHQLQANDTIAVTASDNQVDGLFDQPEGHESDYSFAVPIPYAGPDTAICFNSVYNITHATSYGYQKLKWSTSGDGTFSDNQVLNPVYQPGSKDFSEGTVSLFLTGELFGKSYKDVAIITFHDAPVVHAGADTVILADSSVWLNQASASGYDRLIWTTMGDGIFNNDTIPDPVYTPGATDKQNGEVILGYRGFSACGMATDHIKVTIVAGNTIHGKVHAGTQLAPNSLISLFQFKDSKIKPLRSEIKAGNGTFSINALLPGTIYIYAIPDRLASPDYLPTYFFNDIHWANAHPVNLNGNTYDIDIELEKSDLQLPKGDGVINGYCMSAPGSQVNCGDITIFLYDKQLKNILHWTLVRNGSNFSFTDLPFGEYKLSGEKAGIDHFYSDIIAVTPAHPVVEDVKLVCAPSGYKFSVPADAVPFANNSMNIYPNPVSEILYFSGLNVGENYNIQLYNLQGVLLQSTNIPDENSGYSIDVSKLLPGMYVIGFIQEGENIIYRKFVKN